MPPYGEIRFLWLIENKRNGYMLLIMHRNKIQLIFNNEYEGMTTLGALCITNMNRFPSLSYLGS